jgi:hypothetical protein
MRRLGIVVFAWFISLHTFCLASEQAPGSPGPRMLMEERAFDFGEVKEGEIVSHTFRILNRGDQPLEVVNVKRG